MRALRFIALAIVVVLTFTVVAEAATCVATDIRGTTWFTYVSYAGGWTRCIVRVLASGAIASRTGECRAYDEASKSFATLNVTGGSMNVTTACLVTGSITTSAGTHLVSEARLNQDKSVLVGAGRDGNGDAWTFTAVKN